MHPRVELWAGNKITVGIRVSNGQLLIGHIRVRLAFVQRYSQNLELGVRVRGSSGQGYG